MLCPFCGSNQIAVVNSRPTKGSSQIWRRRKCLKCCESFSTYEKIDLSYLVIIKKSGAKQRFNRAKLFAGIYHTTIDRKLADRGDMSVLAEKMTNLVEGRILMLRKKNVTTGEIKEIVLRVFAKESLGSLLRFIAYKNEADSRSLRRLVKKFL